MKKIIFSSILALAASVTSFAQVTKQVVNVEGFTYSSAFSEVEANTVRNNVIQSLQATKRIIVVDLQQQEAVKAEAERRKSESAMNDEHAVADITQLNANYLIKGTLNSIETKSEQKKNSEGKVYTQWWTTINYTIQLIDPSTGATQSSYNYKALGLSTEGASSARTDAVNSSVANMKKFIEEAFPVKGTIVAVADGDAKKAKKVYINLGNDQGIEKGQKFIVYAVVDIAGEKSEKEVGTLTAEEVMSATRTLCKVNDGGAVIAQNMASNSEMTIKTRAKKGLFADW